ncbi:sigma factor-like helix-turn-helix DNA-binding protein [Skermania sp. ID1734]|uniref:sigma factor-like helix-turn-helix DNA-binding protein n=1 Tax=Skermania sp. ID1734 TaxID=2597516 RepID=UPI0021058D79|nr:sigma factor-like helix-turn-helix DNA-binding protein [Skermania sp. ID1734]
MERSAGVILTLPRELREVLLLRLVVGFSVEDAAGALGVSHGAVRVRQHRALARLKER